MIQINRVQTAAAVNAISSSYDAAKVLEVDMDMFPPDQPFQGYLSQITVQCSAINAASELTLRVCRDEAGDAMIITDTRSDLDTGITTATKGTAIFQLNGYVKLEATSSLFCFVRTDTGSLNVDYIEMTYAGEQ